MKELFSSVTDRLADPHKPAPRVILFGAAGGALAVMAAVLLDELKMPWYVALVPHLMGTTASYAVIGLAAEHAHEPTTPFETRGTAWRLNTSVTRHH